MCSKNPSLLIVKKEWLKTHPLQLILHVPVKSTSFNQQIQSRERFNLLIHFFILILFLILLLAILTPFVLLVVEFTQR
jgi:hypothetical protein